MQNLILINNIPTNEREAFSNKLITIANKIGIPANWLMAVLFLESGLNPKAYNTTGGASGINQLMPATANELGINLEVYRTQTATQQLDGVYAYFYYWRRLWKHFKTWQDLYLLNFYPVALGKGDNYVIGVKGNSTYDWNSAFDVNNDGKITIADFKNFTAKALVRRTGNPNILTALGDTSPQKKKI